MMCCTVPDREDVKYDNNNNSNNNNNLLSLSRT